MIKFKAIPVIESNPKIDGFHLMWNTFQNGRLSVSGYSIWRRKSGRNTNKPVCRLIDGSGIKALHDNSYLLFSGADIIFDRILFQPVTGHDEWKQRLLQVYTLPGASATSTSPVYSYDVHFAEPVFNTTVTVEIKPPYPFILAIGMLDDRVVSSIFQKSSLTISFHEAVDRIRFYILAPAETIRVCYQPADYGKEGDWQLIQKDINLPFKGFSNVTTTAEEFQLFKNRIKDGDIPGMEEFEKIAGLVKNTAQLGGAQQLPLTSILEYLQPVGATPGTKTNMSAAPFSMLQTFNIYHNWRMGLGLGWLDQHQLEQNKVYDYKITGQFHKTVL